MSKTHLIIPDAHSKPDTSNERAEWIGKLILDLKPDVVINGGDQWDFESLCSYDKGKKSFHGRAYKKDLEAGLDFDDKLWYYIRKAKKKRPRAVFLVGNHEHRIQRVLDYQWELDGTIGFEDLDLNHNYDEVIHYEGSSPGKINVDGVNYAHFFVSGVKGLAISGVSPARALLSKQHVSSTSFHLHLTDWAVETNGNNKKIMGLFAGVGHDRFEDFAGGGNHLWWPGVIIKHNVEDGVYEPQWISLQTLKKLYG